MNTLFSMDRASETRFGMIRCLLAGLAGAVLVPLLPNVAGAVFTGGPAVRVSPNTGFEIRWIATFVGDGRVDVFTNANGGTPVVVLTSSSASTEHRLEMTVGGVIQADTTYYFKVTHTDPTGVRGDLTNDPAPYPPVFTGTQAIGDVFVEADVESAVISWEANVIGHGSVLYGTASLDQGPVEDTFNITDHAIELTGLAPGTTYQFRVCNKHAIDGDCLAEATGEFTTQEPVEVQLTQPQAQPRVIQPNGLSLLTVRTLHHGQPLAGVVVWFAIDPGSSGNGTVDGSPSAQATTDANGVASMQFTGTRSGLVHVNVTSPQALNSLTMPVVVR